MRISGNNNNNDINKRVGPATRCWLFFTAIFLDTSIFCSVLCLGKLTQLTISLRLPCSLSMNRVPPIEVANRRLNGKKRVRLGYFFPLVPSLHHSDCCICCLFYGTASVRQLLFFGPALQKLLAFFCSVLTLLSEI